MDRGNRGSTTLGLVILAILAALTLSALAGVRIAGRGNLPLPVPLAAPAPAASHVPAPPIS